MWQSVSNQVFLRFEDSMTLLRNQEFWIAMLINRVVGTQCSFKMWVSVTLLFSGTTLKAWILNWELHQNFLVPEKRFVCIHCKDIDSDVYLMYTAAAHYVQCICTWFATFVLLFLIVLPFGFKLELTISFTWFLF